MAGAYETIRDTFHGNRLLFGDRADDSIVAVEIASPTEVEIFRRREGKLERERGPLRLFILLDDPSLIDKRIPHESIPLLGDFRFRQLAAFSSTGALDDARRHLRGVTGMAPSAPGAPYLILSDPIEQHL